MGSSTHGIQLYSLLDLSYVAQSTAYVLTALCLSVVINIVWQFLPKKRSEPPLVFHFIPFIGNAVSYGTNPFDFYTECRKKYGDVFTFILFGKKMTVYLGIEGNEFILNGKLHDVNAEEIYGPLTTPVFEVRRKLTAEFAELYHDLDLGFRPINFLMPWAPLPQNRRRDAAHAKMRSIYVDIINKRRDGGGRPEDEEIDMIWHLMDCVYKNGTPVPDKEIAHMMITLLMAGQHSSSSSSSWIMLRLASRPDLVEELYNEQVERLGYDGTQPLQFADIDKLPLLQGVVKETLRVHSSIHSLMRKVKNPMPVPGTDYVVTPDKVLVASPIVTHMSEEYFARPLVWDPYRWSSLDVEKEIESDMVDYGYGLVSKGTRSPYLPFGAGRHRCIGEKFAFVNLVTIISTMIRHFKFNTMDGKSWVPPTDYTSLFSRPTQPADIRWERRFAEKD